MAKSKIHNFGELGKWSEDTLKAQMIKETWGYGSPLITLKIKIIEDNYEKKIEDYDEIRCEKVKKMDIRDIRNKLKELEDEDKLIKDYEKYQKVMRKFNKKKGGKK